MCISGRHWVQLHIQGTGGGTIVYKRAAVFIRSVTCYLFSYDPGQMCDDPDSSKTCPQYITTFTSYARSLSPE